MTRPPAVDPHRALMAAALAVSERLREHEMRRMARLRETGSAAGGTPAEVPSRSGPQRSSSIATDGAAGAGAAEPAS